jgi:hypothetical protein
LLLLRLNSLADVTVDRAQPPEWFAVEHRVEGPPTNSARLIEAPDKGHLSFHRGTFA